VVRHPQRRNPGEPTVETRESRDVRRYRCWGSQVRPRHRRNRRRITRPKRRARAVGARPTRPLAEGTRICELGETASCRGRTTRRVEEQATGLPAQTVELLRPRIQPRGR